MSSMSRHDVVCHESASTMPTANPNKHRASAALAFKKGFRHGPIRFSEKPRPMVLIFRPMCWRKRRYQCRSSCISRSWRHTKFAVHRCDKGEEATTRVPAQFTANFMNPRPIGFGACKRRWCERRAPSLFTHTAPTGTIPTKVAFPEDTAIKSTS